MELSDLFKQAKAMQERAGAMQAVIATLTAEGVSGGGMVRMVLNGKSELQKLSLDPALFKAEDREMVEDLIVAAHADAKAKLERLIGDEMQKLAGELGLPPGMNLGL